MLAHTLTFNEFSQVFIENVLRHPGEDAVRLCWLKTAPCNLQASCSLAWKVLRLNHKPWADDKLDLRGHLCRQWYVLPSKRFSNGRNNSWQMGTMFRPPFPTPPPPSDASKLDIEAFFNKYRSLLTPEGFARFHNLVSKTRPSRGHRYFISSFDGRLEFEHDCYARMDAQRSKEADLSKLEMILVEDVDVRCLVALDATYQLDPQFLLAYTGAGHRHSPDIEAVADPADVAGKWYTTEISMLLQFPWQVEDSRIVKRFASLEESWYKRLLKSRPDTEPDAAKPWWKEHVRTDSGMAITKISSKVACYCLTDKLRESGRISDSPAVDRR
jgi:hypothetical protein